MNIFDGFHGNSSTFGSFAETHFFWSSSHIPLSCTHSVHICFTLGPSRLPKIFIGFLCPLDWQHACIFAPHWLTATHTPTHPTHPISKSWPYMIDLIERFYGTVSSRLDLLCASGFFAVITAIIFLVDAILLVRAGNRGEFEYWNQ